MSPDNTFDFSNGVGYNEGNDVNETVIVKMDEQRPANDIDCKHETIVADPDDRIGNAIYHGCSNPKCGRGFYLQNKNIT
jgi:hypothetical protein